MTKPGHSQYCFVFSVFRSCQWWINMTPLEPSRKWCNSYLVPHKVGGVKRLPSGKGSHSDCWNIHHVQQEIHLQTLGSIFPASYVGFCQSCSCFILSLLILTHGNQPIASWHLQKMVENLQVYEVGITGGCRCCYIIYVGSGLVSGVGTFPWVTGVFSRVDGARMFRWWFLASSGRVWQGFDMETHCYLDKISTPKRTSMYSRFADVCFT